MAVSSGAVPAEAGREKHLPAFLQRAVDETADQPALLGPGLRFVADVQPEEGKRRDSKEGCRPPGREMNDRRDAGLAGEVVPVIGDVGASASVDAIVDPGHAASLRRGEEYTPGKEFGVAGRPYGPGDSPAVMSHPGGQWSRNRGPHRQRMESVGPLDARDDAIERGPRCRGGGRSTPAQHLRPGQVCFAPT